MDVTTLTQQLQNVSLESDDKGVQALIAGYEDVLQALREVLVWPFTLAKEADSLGLRWPKGCLLIGPPGVGKTTLVQAVAREANAKVFNVTSSSIVGAYLGESEKRLRQVFADAEAAAAEGPTFVFIDEVDALCPRRGSGGDAESRLVAQLLTLLDGAATGTSERQNYNTIRVVAATNRPNAVDLALRRPGRLDREITVAPPNATQREAILRLRTANMPLADDVSLGDLAERTHGYTGADITALCREAATTTLVIAARTPESARGGHLPRVTSAHFDKALTSVRPSLVRSLRADVPSVSWDDIGGLQHVKQRLKQSVEWPLLHRDAFERLAIAVPRGVLLHGPPGCCKSTLARAVATSSCANMIPLSASSLYSMYIGEGEALLQHVFKQARLSAPSIVFLDELDALFGRRGSDGGDATEPSVQLLSALLTEMDGMERATGVLVLAATNRPDQIDAALLRPGRFDVLLFVPPPDVEGRLKALQVHTTPFVLDRDVSLDALARQMKYFTGAEVQHVCEEAALHAARRLESSPELKVRQADFDAVMATMQPSLTEELIEQYEAWGSKYSR